MAADIGTNSTREFNSFSHTISSIYKNKGFTALYKGFTAGAAGIFIYRGIYFGAFDTGKIFFFTDYRKANFLS